MKKTSLSIDQQSQGQSPVSLWRHAAVCAHRGRALEAGVDSELRPWQPLTNVDNASLPVHETGQSFTHVPAHASSPAVPVNYATPACPAFPRRCPFGGACHTCPVTVQTKLAINQPGDSYEQEADRMAERVMRMPESSTPTRTASAVGSSLSAAPPIVHEVLSSPGQPLDMDTRAFFETRFGYDFSQIRVHTDARAAESARAVSALGYTVGHNLVFGMGHYAPHRREGSQLLAHELVHALQQRSVSPRQFLTSANQPNDRGEQTAESAAPMIELERNSFHWGSLTTALLLQRHVTHSSAGRIGGAEEYLRGSGAEGRYLFTLRGGWLDRTHVEPHIRQANQLMADLEARRAVISVESSGFRTNYHMNYGQIPAPVDQDKMEQVALAIMTDHDYRFEAHQSRSVRNVVAQTPFSYEDLPSDRVGSEIGLRYRRQARAAGLNPDEGLNTGNSPQAQLLSSVTRRVVLNLQPVSAWQGIELYRGFLQSQGREVHTEFESVPQGAPIGVIRSPMLPGLGWARTFFQGYSGVRQLYEDYRARNPRHFRTSPYQQPILSPVRDPAPFLVNQPPDWAWQAAGLDRNVFNRAIQELPRSWIEMSF